MAFTMKLSKEQIEGKEVAPENIYELKLVGFKPKFSTRKPDSKPDWTPSLNLNARMEIVNNPEQEGKLVYELLNMKSFMFADFCHAFGLPLDVFEDGSQMLPGNWDEFDEQNPDAFKYDGPLLGRTCRADVAIDTYNGRQSNKVRQYFCAIDDCQNKFPEIRHSTNLLGKKQ